MILVTGGAGYIGSHTVLELLSNGYDVLVVDNECNSSQRALKRVEKLTGKQVIFARLDITNAKALTRLFERYTIEAVIHFAGLKAVGESVEKPLRYYQNNVGGTVSLLQAMDTAGVSNFIFSSSATVYGDESSAPYIESYPLGMPSSPYGKTKAFVEQIVTDWQSANSRASVSILRYFNPVGAHESGDIGEDPQGIPNNLMPFIAQVAVGRREKLSVFGGDYDTADGSCERDYIHVVDLAKGHVAALKHLKAGETAIYNLGTGKPTSVLQMVESFERVNSVKIPYEIVERRPGDLPSFWANADKAKRELGWYPEKTLDDMMRDTWRWQKKNPNGYE